MSQQLSWDGHSDGLFRDTIVVRFLTGDDTSNLDRECTILISNSFSTLLPMNSFCISVIFRHTSTYDGGPEWFVFHEFWLNKYLGATKLVNIESSFLIQFLNGCITVTSLNEESSPFIASYLLIHVFADKPSISLRKLSLSFKEQGKLQILRKIHFRKIQKNPPFLMIILRIHKGTT